MARDWRWMTQRTWINGQAVAQLAVEDRGLQYGDGLFETITCVAGHARWLSLHLGRLRLGCERLQLRFDQFEALEAEIAALAVGQQRCLLKLILTRGVARRRGYAPLGDETPTRILTRYEWPESVPQAWSGFRVGVSGVTLGMNPLLAGLKHLNRLEQVLAQNEMRGKAVNETLMLSSAGQVICGTMSNVFFADESGWFTPALADCGVAGVMRSLVLAKAADCGFAVTVRPVERAELPTLREAFVTNVRWGLQPIDVLEERALTLTTQAQRLRQLINATNH
jgi:4-amino-4-deoxychorismate lyase